MADLDNRSIINAIMADIRRVLDVDTIELAGEGLEFRIYKASTSSGDVAIKIPKDKIFSNVNDAHIEAKTLLDQEYRIMQFLSEHGVTQIPTPIMDFESNDFGILIMSYIPSDDSPANQYQLGKLLATIHSLQPPTLSLSAQEGLEIPALIQARLLRRWRELQNFVANLPDLPSDNFITRSLAETTDIKSLLHMDYRNANLRTNQGTITGVVDWSNALIGHPALELARVAETGETTDEFLRGYAAVRAIEHISVANDTIFRLDTATMLALVFLSEAPDPHRAPMLVQRVKTLHGKLHSLAKA